MRDHTETLTPRDAATDRTRQQAVADVGVVRSGETRPVPDQVAVEAPIEVRLNGAPFSVIMRTPGDDRDLALGFLFGEGLIEGRNDIERVDVDDTAEIVNVVFVCSQGDAVTAALSERRQVTMNSSCGMCGRRKLESLAVSAPRPAFDWTVSPAAVQRLPERLRDAQSVFARTGGLHAAALFDVDGRLEASAEDVGRHNAVDKLIGRMLEEGRLPLNASLLFVSGRSSFEIVQKAWRAGIGLIAAVSAPSSLAIDLARAASITLLGFVREGRFNIYTHPQRIRGVPVHPEPGPLRG
jgi:FdhD protein